MTELQLLMKELDVLDDAPEVVVETQIKAVEDRYCDRSRALEFLPGALSFLALVSLWVVFPSLDLERHSGMESRLPSLPPGKTKRDVRSRTCYFLRETMRNSRVWHNWPILQIANCPVCGKIPRPTQPPRFDEQLAV